MEIKHKFELQTITNRRYIIRQSSEEKQIGCPECNETMLTTEQAAGIFETTQRRIFQTIESKSVHFIEIKTGAVMICPQSLANHLTQNQEKP